MQNNSSRPLAARASAQVHTPTQSQSFSGNAFTPDSIEGKTIHWNDKRSREEFELARAKLSDQMFNIRDYEDPLLPRQIPPSQYYPKGVTAETETRLLKLIADVKDSSTKTS
ncbi:uncharacterized protein F4822DRAFT_411432 [Hypoxylon trugodes]|uniref:uncharacterized protein n=1 Tax=Hypoxylon trugodes TaxID=326681 RepID=UPI002196F74C|nr:uncharacterized protein F4822DRAFT_411432 [Hypoxylon trugodes]KAI1386858.1 hypothetical protein F4822DRAFT_411432 [Hypoxylon trugodes]